MDKHIIADATTTGQVFAYCDVCLESRTAHKDSIVIWAQVHKVFPCVPHQ